MNRLFLIISSFILMFSLNGCVSSIVNDAIDQADEKIRLKWAEEWKPTLLKEVKDTVSEGKELAVKEVSVQIEKYRSQTNGKLERIGVKVEEFDKNQDGKVSGVETLALLKEIKTKNEENGDPLSWWEIVAALAMGYLPATAAKEVVKKKLNGTGDGSA
jgi:hypothetical protein